MNPQELYPHFDQVDFSGILTPCLAVSPEQIRQNLQAMIAIAGSADRLRPHVKTHKCPQIVQMALQLGITRHKCATLAEAEMLAQLCDDVLIAYPLVGPNASKLAKLVCSYPQVSFASLVDSHEGAVQLSQAFAACGKTAQVLIDVNVGMDRTGITPDRADELAGRIQQLDGIKLVGLHVYDGHNHQPQLDQRQVAVASLMQPVLKLIGRCQQMGLPIRTVICGGTPTFPVFAQWAANHPTDSWSIELSPGTTVLSDHNYGCSYPDIVGIRPAAVLYTRVISKPSHDLITVDLGHKAIAADPPAGRRCHFIELPDAEEFKQSEEHLVLRTSKAASVAIGTLLRVVPIHICPTVALHESLIVIENQRVSGSWPVTRHRLYQL